jgi:hypothetical protein
MEKNILIENLIKQLFTKKRKAAMNIITVKVCKEFAEDVIYEICNVKFGG